MGTTRNEQLYETNTSRPFFLPSLDTSIGFFKALRGDFFFLVGDD